MRLFLTAGLHRRSLFCAVKLSGQNHSCCGGWSDADNVFQATMPVMRQQPSSSESLPQGELQRILHLEVPVIVKLAERKLLLSEVMRLGVGAIIEFFKSSEEPLQLLINNKPIAVGEAVKVGENFGLRIKQVGDLKQLIASLAADSR
jgi:flagellar motor switch protein FliN/FliY